jgi:hypothetical protein
MVLGGRMSKRNYEFRNVPGVYHDIKVNRDGDVQVNGRPVYNLPIITAEDGTKMTIQMCIHKAFPDIPLRRVPKW